MVDWEDEVMHDPDGVEVTAIFEDLHSHDPRVQYDAAAGLYWLADYRPERLQSWENDLFDLLGTLENYGLGSDSVLGTRRWVADSIHQYVREYPHRIRDVISLLDSADPRRRADVILTIAACIEGKPSKFVEENAKRAELLSPLEDRFDQIAQYLSEEYAEIRPSAVLVLAEIISRRPEKAAQLVPRIVSFLEDRVVGFPAVFFLREVALHDDSQTAEITTTLIDYLESLDTTEPLKLPGQDFMTLMAILQTLAAIASQNPEYVERTACDARNLSTSEINAISGPAMEILDELESQRQD